MTDPSTLPEYKPEHPRPTTQHSPDVTAEAEQRQASEFATHGDPTLHDNSADPASRRPGVQWVRPTDLAARAGGVIIDRGMELNTRLRDAVLEGVRQGRAHMADRLASRQAQLDPENGPTRTTQRSLGRTGVSR